MNSNLASHCRRWILWGLKLGLQVGAKFTGRRFACQSLSGTVHDGLFVNSDMTVSCNCQDVDGSGQLGSLRAHSLEELLAGPTAGRFRRELAAGRLPVSRCPACFHLRMVPRAVAAARAIQFRLPAGLSVENTVLCNLRCTGCCREEVLRTRKQGHALGLDDVRIVAETLARLRATYCGYYNLGEPFLSRTICRELELLRRHNPQMEILTSTNGLLVDSDEKREAALLADHVLFSIDGVDTAMVRRYQRGGDFDRAYANMRRLVEFRNGRGLARPCVYWKYVVFRWNDRPATIRRAIELARQAGVDCLQLTFARSPLWGISWRFLLSPWFRSLGTGGGWRFRNVWFSEPVKIGSYPRPASGATEIRAA
jgi:pyruvate-formate lyase-activating enzyme